MIYLLLCSGGEASATTKSGVLSAPFINSVRISGILTILILSSLTLSFLPPACGMVFRRLEFLFYSPLGTFRFFQFGKRVNSKTWAFKFHRIFKIPNSFEIFAIINIFENFQIFENFSKTLKHRNKRG